MTELPLKADIQSLTSMSPDYSGKFRVGHSLKRPISRFRLKALRQSRRYHPQVFMGACLSNFRDYVSPVSIEVIRQSA